MNKQETEGLVIEIKGEFALVMPNAQNDCGCEHGAGVRRIVVEMKNDINAVAGDRVIFEDGDGATLSAAFIIFIVPIILIISGAVAGYNMAGSLGVNATITATVGGILSFVVSLIIIKMYEKFVSKDKNLKPVMIRKA